MPACSSNYTNMSRPSTYPINYVVIHKVEGSASGAASWFQNCSAAVSAHFIFNNSTGYCYQSVYEADEAWHAGWADTNRRGVGIEHGGYTASNDVATVCYDESAIETKSCIIYYSVTHDRSHVIGHYQVPGCSGGTGGGTGCHTDPGSYWNWTYYMTKCDPAGGTITAKNYIDDTPAASASWITATSAARRRCPQVSGPDREPIALHQAQRGASHGGEPPSVHGHSAPAGSPAEGTNLSGTTCGKAARAPDARG